MRKLSAHKIFDGYRFLNDVVLVINDDGVVENILPLKDAGDGVEFFEGVITPGFINCHCHLELSHTRGLVPEQTGLVDFVYKIVTQRHFAEAEILKAIADAEAEMINNGIVAVGDICNNTHTLRQKQKGNLRYYNFIEASGWLPSVATERFERARLVYEAFVSSQQSGVQSSKSGVASQKSTVQSSKSAGQSSRQINSSIVPHAPYSVAENLWQLMQPFFAGKVVSIHNQETRFEDEFFSTGTGDFKRMYQMMNIDNRHHQPTKKSSLQSYFHWLADAATIIFVHNTFTSEDDVLFVKKQQVMDNVQFATDNLQIGDKQLEPRKGEQEIVSLEDSKTSESMNAENPELQTPIPIAIGTKPQTFFCLCINANQYIENALPPIEMLRKNTCTIVLGTDSLASNWSLNILDEIKTIRQNFPAIALEEMLQWSTINGARALQMNDMLGSFEKGKKPGIVLIDEKKLVVKKVLA